MRRRRWTAPGARDGEVLVGLPNARVGARAPCGVQRDPTPTPAPARERIQEQHWPPNPGNSKNCADFLTQREAQDWFDRYYPYYGDVARLDRDGDGFACEALP